VNSAWVAEYLDTISGLVFAGSGTNARAIVPAKENQISAIAVTDFMRVWNMWKIVISGNCRVFLLLYDSVIVKSEWLG
jgi:hypothetical protein